MKSECQHNFMLSFNERVFKINVRHRTLALCGRSWQAELLVPMAEDGLRITKRNNAGGTVLHNMLSSHNNTATDNEIHVNDWLYNRRPSLVTNGRNLRSQTANKKTKKLTPIRTIRYKKKTTPKFCG
jgi:hypothetical protein